MQFAHCRPKTTEQNYLKVKLLTYPCANRVAVLYLQNIPMYTTNISKHQKQRNFTALRYRYQHLINIGLCETALSEKPLWWQWMPTSNSTKRLATICEAPFSFPRPI